MDKAVIVRSQASAEIIERCLMRKCLHIGLLRASQHRVRLVRGPHPPTTRSLHHRATGDRTSMPGRAKKADSRTSDLLHIIAIPDLISRPTSKEGAPSFIMVRLQLCSLECWQARAQKDGDEAAMAGTRILFAYLAVEGATIQSGLSSASIV